MRIAEPGLHFWLNYLEAEGGVWEAQSETSALAVLPSHLSESFQLGEEVLVSTDPEVVREEGGVLLIPGHPALDEAASKVLDRGDVGSCYLAWPAKAPPTLNTFVETARQLLPVDHGRIDPGPTEPASIYLPVLRIAVMVRYSLSLQDHFQEREEVWVNACNGRVLGAEVAEGLRAGLLTGLPDSSRPLAPADLHPAIAAAHGALQTRVAARCTELAGYAGFHRSLQLSRTAAYYEAVLDSIDHRRTSASPERARLLDAQAEATRIEQTRRMAEVEESYQATFEIRPFRLHLVGVPALQFGVSVRRGTRSYPMELTWLLGPRQFAPAVCPECGSTDLLVAGRQRLGCRACLPPAAGRPELSSVPAPEAKRRNGAGDRAAGGIPGGNNPDSEPGGQSPPPERNSGPARTTGERRGNGLVGPSGKDAAGSRSKGPDGRRSAARETPAMTEHRMERIYKLGGKLSMGFWQAAAGDLRWRSKQTAAGSPLASLHRLYGAAGAMWAIGMSPGELPGYISAVTMEPLAGKPELTGGGIEALESGFRYPFWLRWTAQAGVAVVSEVLPMPPPDDPRVPGWSRLPSAVVARLHRPPNPRVELDGVESALWSIALPAHGLPLVVQALALRDRLAAVDLPDLPDEVLAAGALYVTLKASGTRASVTEVAAGFGAEVEIVRVVVRNLQQLLRQHPLI